MNKNIEIIRKTRTHLLQFIEGLSIEELNRIPAGFNNNIAWNFIHLMAAQQNVCYLRAGKPAVIDQKFITPFLPGTKPEGFITDEDMAEARSLFLTTIDQLEADYESGALSAYPAWTNRYGIEHNSIEDTLCFLPFHEGLHLGYIMALKRSIGKAAV